MQLARVASGYPMAPAIQLGRTRMLRDMVPRWNVQQANAPGVYGLPLVIAVGLQRHEGGAGQAHQGKGRVEPEDPSIRQAKRARALQTELKRVGCDPGAVDGRWGEKAKAALGQFINL